MYLKLKSKKNIGIGTIAKIQVEGGMYTSPNGLIHHNCQYCIKNHLLSDKITPRVFKFSELSHSYLTTADRKSGAVSTCGLHPRCRCSLVLLSPGFGFKDGRVTFIGLGHNEYDRQRNTEANPKA
jgi:hypothetical protein